MNPLDDHILSIQPYREYRSRMQLLQQQRAIIGSVVSPRRDDLVHLDYFREKRWFDGQFQEKVTVTAIVVVFV